MDLSVTATNNIKPMGQKTDQPNPTSPIDASTEKPATPVVPLHGIPDFHVVEEVGDHVPMAHMEIDNDVRGRVNTGTGDQPGNTEDSRFATPSASTGEDTRP